MSDIDADLLALAGDDSEGEEPQQTQVPAAESIGEPEASEDEVAMEESDGEAPGDNESEPERSETYPVDGKFKSEQERDEIMAMPEIDREQILAERADELLREEQARKLKAIWSNYTKEQKEQTDKKRKASESDLRDGKKNARQKTIVTSTRAEKLAELRQSRADKGNRKPTGRKTDRSSETPDADADGESEGDWDDRPRRDQTPEEQPPTKRDFDRIKVGRTQFASVCFHPGFEAAMHGCYVRLSVGPDKNNRSVTVYRMAKIEGIIEKQPYAVVGREDKVIVTTQHVVASIGKNKRESPFIHCSMSEFTQSEIDYYMNELKQTGLPTPKKTKLEAKTRDIQSLINHRFTADEINEKLAKSKNLQQRWKDSEKERLRGLQAEAEQVGETERVQVLQDQIDNIDKNPVKLFYQTSLGPSKPRAGETPQKSAMTQQQRLAELNKQNSKNDKLRIRQALLDEQRAAAKRQAAAREAAIKQEQEAEDAEDAVNVVQNIFSAKDDLELPHPEWKFNYVDYSNKYLGSRAMMHLSYDEKGRAVCDWPRELCDDEVIARMDIPITCVVPEY